MRSEEPSQQPEKDAEPPHSVNTAYLLETVKELQLEVETLRLEARKRQKTQSGTITIVFLVTGVAALVASLFTGSQVLAFIGLSLTFWGALFLFVRPVKFVQSSLLDSTALATYTTIDRIIRELKYKGDSYYIPPYPQDVYLPDHLKGLKDMTVFVSADTGTEMPTIEDMASGRFHMKPKGICIAPPGLGLATRFEEELKKDFTKQKVADLCETLPQVILENLQLAREATLQLDRSHVYLTLRDSAYKTLYDPNQDLTSVHKLGCPIISAVACALAKASGKPVTITKDRVSPDLQTIEAWYQLVGA